MSILLSYKLQMEDFKKKNPYSILHISKDDVFHRPTINDEYIPNNDGTDYMIYNRENYDEKIKQEYSKQGINYDYNAMFVEGNINALNQIKDKMKIPTIIRDPNITKYGDTYSQTEFVTNILDNTAGNIEHIVYRNRNDIIRCEDELSSSSCNKGERFRPKKQCRPDGCTRTHCCHKKERPSTRCRKVCQ